MKTPIAIIVVLCILATPVVVHADDTPTPTEQPTEITIEAASETTPVVMNTGDAPTSTEEPMEATQEATSIPATEISQTKTTGSNPTLFDVAQTVVNTAEIISTGDPSGILGAPAHNAPAGTPFQYYKVAPGQPTGCTLDSSGSTEVLICYWDSPLQQAISDAATGSTVTVDGGSYSEDLEISKSITLFGKNSPVLIAPVNLDSDFDSGGQTNRAVINVNGTSGVVIDGFTINGDKAGDTNYRFIGVVYHNASGTIQNNSITSFRDSSLNGTSSGLGVYILNDDGVSRTVNVLDNVITDYQKGGIVASGQGLTVDIAGNTIVGQGPTTAIDQNGIQISGNASGMIDSNAISQNWSNLTSGTAAGVVVYNNTAPLTISNNRFNGNQVNIRIQDSNNVDILGNTIVNGSRGIEIVSITGFGEANATITGNVISGNEWGVFTDNTHTVVTNNSFVGNLSGLVFNNANQWNYNEMLSAMDNYWGCPTGPFSNDPNCDSVLGLIMYQPFEPAPGITIEQYLQGNPISIPSTLEPEVIPVVSGQVVVLSCNRANILQMSDGDEVGFNSILCGYSARVDSSPMTMTISILQDGAPMDILPNGAIARISFAIPAGLKSPYAILFWDEAINGGAGDWMVLPTASGYLSTGDERMVTSGVTAANGKLTVEVNFNGTFVLVGQ